MLGAAYSTLFPRRLDRLVLDSPPDYDTVWRRYELDRTAAMQANYDAFTAWLADRDSSFGFGAAPAAVDAALTALVARANAAAGPGRRPSVDQRRAGVPARPRHVLRPAVAGGGARPGRDPGPCAFWPTSADNTIPLAANRARGALVTAARQDAAVPLANSVATKDAIAGAGLVTVDRRVHVPFLSGQANDCMTAAVTRYLLTGELPPTDLAC